MKVNLSRRDVVDQPGLSDSVRDVFHIPYSASGLPGGCMSQRKLFGKLLSWVIGVAAVGFFYAGEALAVCCKSSTGCSCTTALSCLSAKNKASAAAARVAEESPSTDLRSAAFPAIRRGRSLRTVTVQTVAWVRSGLKPGRDVVCQKRRRLRAMR